MGGRVRWIVGGAVTVLLVSLGAWGAVTAKDFYTAASAGKAQAIAGVHAFEAKDFATAAAAFADAQAQFTHARGLLGPEWLRGLPWVGRQLSAADDLTAIGAEASSAGSAATGFMTQVKSISGEGGLGRMVQTARPFLDSALSSLVVVAQHSQRLSTDGLVSPLADAVAEVQQQLLPLRHVLDRSESLLNLERYFFSAQHRFLVPAQNNAEIRPTGGFPGTYGLVEFGPEGLKLSSFKDVLALPRDTLNLPNPDGRVANRHFYFRNANWWIDFPTSANVMLQLWQNMRQPQVDGIIAIDLPTIRGLLEVFGAITVPESKIPLTADNVVERLSYIVELEFSGHTWDSPKKKEAVVSLAGAVVDRLVHPREGELAATIESLARSASERHIQVYLTDPDAQANVVKVGWSGAIDPPDGMTDLVAVSNAIILPGPKANLGVDKSLDYTVSFAGNGTASTTLGLGYRKGSENPLGEHQRLLSNYVRVHRATGTVLTGKAPGIAQLNDATKLPTFAHFFQLESGASTTVTVSTSVPGALRFDSDGTAHYRLLIVKQADLVDADLTVQVTAPEGWQVASAAGTWRGTGDSVAGVVSGNSVRFAQSLRQDVVIDVVLTKS